MIPDEFVTEICYPVKKKKDEHTLGYEDKPVAGSFLLTENILQRIRINNRNHRRGIDDDPGFLQFLQFPME